MSDRIIDPCNHLPSCPFCGGSKQFITYGLRYGVEIGHLPTWEATVHCHKCGATVSALGEGRETATENAKAKWCRREPQ